MNLQYYVNLYPQWKIWGHYISTAKLEIIPWCEENCIGKFERPRNGYLYLWAFEQLEDALAFRLRWGEQEP